ncbi:hypothetical protein SLS62_010255 [Diatrype stigma]|uniref:Histidine decarboxylase n=1 Tax=Diatrype stigma TaxID=117547 RepID=A0AAN9UCW9_9PEZI
MMLLHDSTVLVEDLEKEVFISELDDVPGLPLSLDGYSLEGLKSSFSTTETELSIPKSESHDSGDSVEPPTQFETIQQTFQNAQSQWIDDPIISQWRDPNHRIHQVLSKVNALHHTWSSIPNSPFSPAASMPNRQIGRILAEVGLPWHNNQINMPDEVDTSWPFHFKSFEREVIQAKGTRVGDPAASGYVCNYSEANLYCIRALQQELREKCPTRKPLVVFDRFNAELLQSAKVFFGLELYHVDLSQGKEKVLRDVMVATCDGIRPIIFAATLGNASGESDDLGTIREISGVLHLLLHVDASRNFDYVTTMPEDRRRQLGCARLALGMKPLDRPIQTYDGSIIASTIVAGGLNLDASAPAVALKPASLGGKHARVAYTRASDSTLAGSRDAVSVLWLALQEFRFGESGYRAVYQRCAELRAELIRVLRLAGVTAIAPTTTLDVVIKTSSVDQNERLIGLVGSLTERGEVILTIQPGVTPEDVNSVIAIMSSSTDHPHGIVSNIRSNDNSISNFPLSEGIIDDLRATVESWKTATRSAAGYPFHMGSLSALGPIIGRFLDTPIPQDWVQERSAEILRARIEAFGCCKDQSVFQGAFTNGSTMGNRVGIHVALAHFPGAFVYFSSESHYSVAKTLRDCDELTNRWGDHQATTTTMTNGRSRERRRTSPRYAQIPCYADGSMSVEALVRQAAADKQRWCMERGGEGGEEFRVVLFANMGTTFVGARDDIVRIRDALRTEAGIKISYIHVDGALDFGFDSCGITLGPPPGFSGEGKGTPTSNAMAVQGITLSHHKAMGGTVSGEVLCYSPGGELASLVSPVEPRIVFETWLYGQVYTPADAAAMLAYCRANAARLIRGLEALGVATKTKAKTPQQNENNREGEGESKGEGEGEIQQEQQQMIVVLERPPAWIIEEFSLRPEGDWVHFIPMPHVSAETVDFFVERIAAVDRQCGVAFGYVAPLLSAAFAPARPEPVTLNRVHCCSRGIQAEEIVRRAAAAAAPLRLRSSGAGTAAVLLGEKGEHLLARSSSGSDDGIGGIVKVCLRGSVSIAVTSGSNNDNDGDNGHLQAVFLAESMRDMSIRVGPIMLASCHVRSAQSTVDIAKQLWGFMARHMHARLQLDELSYSVYLF